MVCFEGTNFRISIIVLFVQLLREQPLKNLNLRRMMKNTKWYMLVVVLLLGAFTLAACGGGQEATPTQEIGRAHV